MAGTGRDSGDNVHEATIGAPRWVKVSAIIAVVVVLLLIIVLIASGGGSHGPSRHGLPASSPEHGVGLS